MRDRGIGSGDDFCKDDMKLGSYVNGMVSSQVETKRDNPCRSSSEAFSAFQRDHGYTEKCGTSGYIIRPHVEKTGACRQSGRPYVGVPGASCPTGRSQIEETSCPNPKSHIGETGASCPFRRPHIGETGASCPIRTRHVGETGADCPKGNLPLGETGASHNNRFLHVGETEAIEYTKEPKIPVCDGKEDWTVWINRFEAIARLRCWDEGRKLNVLLPKLQGKAGEYAFAVLPKKSLSSYEELVSELNSRFRKVEIPRVFASLFHNRVQGENESVQDFAVELRCLYFKAYKHRNKQTREEDLLQRFLSELRDDNMRFSIEFHKEPSSLDEAVYYAVEYAELRRQIFEGPYADKAYSKQGREECKYYKTQDIVTDCCNPERLHKNF